MKVLLLAGFLALLILLVADVVMANRTIARLQREQRRTTNRHESREGGRAHRIRAGVGSQPVEAAVLLQKVADLLVQK